MPNARPTRPDPSTRVRLVLFPVLGAATGLLLGLLGYLLFEQYTDGRGGTLEEFQGMVSNLVPLGLLLGGVLGFLLARPRGPRPPTSSSHERRPPA
ncbi:hypothetical protein [Nocardioides sp.]|uniref:hypothetical protein n=1 Tax=Nocardioides sp. TaxID=35761 RepID=UPI00356B3177